MSKKYKLNCQVTNFGPKSQKLHSLDYNSIELLDGPFKEAFDWEYDYYLNISVDDMLYEMRKKANLDTRGGKTLASEASSWFHIGANVLGQWLQAYARFYRSTGRIEAKQKAIDLVSGLAEIAKISPCFFDGLGMYFFEKYLRGLTDCWLFCEIEQAYELAEGFIREAMNSEIYTKAKLLLGDNGPSPEIEWYTIPESILYFADAKEREKGINADDYRAFAKKFAYDTYWDIFQTECKHFHDYSPLGGQNTAYFHAYSHLNTLNSAAYFYQVTNDEYYFNVIKNCYNWMKKEQAIATGAYGLHIEWLMPDTGKITALHNFHDSFESQCNSYAVYRVSNFLMAMTGEAKYGDWSERLLYNATFASIHTDKEGHAFYYSDYNVNSSKKYRHPDTWTCCTGSRPLLLNELRRSIYFYNESGVYIAQYLASKVDINGTKITIEGNYPIEDKVNLKVNFANKPNAFVLYLRKPDWSNQAIILLNGKEVEFNVVDGWIAVSGDWQENNTVVLQMPTSLRVESIVAKKCGVAAIMEGPVCLASEGGIDAGSETDFDQPYNCLEKIAPLHYQHKQSKTKWKPFFEYGEEEPYHLYFSLNEKLK